MSEYYSSRAKIAIEAMDQKLMEANKHLSNAREYLASYLLCSCIDLENITWGQEGIKENAVHAGYAFRYRESIAELARLAGAKTVNINKSGVSVDINSGYKFKNIKSVVRMLDGEERYNFNWVRVIRGSYEERDSDQ